MMGERQNIISDRQYDGLCQIVEQIHDDSPVITERIKDFYVRRIATYLGLTIDKYWTYEGDTTGALENEGSGENKQTNKEKEIR